MLVLTVLTIGLACGRGSAEAEARPQAPAARAPTPGVSTATRSSVGVDRTLSTRELAPAPDGVLEGSIVDEMGAERSLRLVLAPTMEDVRERVAGQRMLNDVAMDRGRFRFEGVPAGRYELRLCEELYCMEPLRIESDGRGVAGIRLVARLGVPVRIELAARGTLRIRDAFERTWHERGHDGTALLALLPGVYELGVFDGTGAERIREFELRDAPLSIDLRE